MNELFFFLHIGALVGFILLAFRFGKEALVSIFILQIVLANLFVTKQMTCFGLDVTCTDVYTIGAIFSMNLLQVYFGKQIAQKALKMLFFLLFFVLAMSYLHLHYFPSKFDTMQESFSTILGQTPRIMFVSLVSIFLMQKLDIEWFGFLKKRLPKAPFWIPFTLASLTTQFLDTVIFSYGALYGIVHSMRDIILMSFLIKVIVIFSIAPLTFFVKKWIPYERAEV